MTHFPRGSEWRRWDLHVHTPLSIIQNYGGDSSQAWDAFIERLKTLPPDIQVLGITDYLFIDGYEKLLARRAEIPNITAIFPNLEFRLDTFSGTAENSKRHNFHVIFDPSVSPKTIREQLLNCLATGYTIKEKDVWNQTPTRDSLAELGAKLKNATPGDNTIHNKTDLVVGFESITYKREDILALLRKDCFVGRFITAIGYSEWDQAKWDQSAARKRDLINTAHFSLISNDNVEKIAEHREGLKRLSLNSLLLHSSDAHALERLDGTKLWVKADPTFAGLKQIINQPDRIFLGDSPPRFKAPHQIISKIRIPASEGWFAPDFDLELNDGLVAIIGGRGSGKSALAEMIACSVGAADASGDSFINKAIKHASSIQDTEVQIEWADGTASTGLAGGDEFDQGLVKFLPQRAVEELCSPEQSETLIEQIESVIFQSLDETTRRGSSDFAELKNTVLASYAFEREEIVSALATLNRDIYSLDTAVGLLETKRKDVETKRKELAKLEETLPKLPTADEKAQNELAGYIAQKTTFEAKIVSLKKTQDQIVELRTRVKVFAASFVTFRKDLIESIAAVGASSPEGTRAIFDADYFDGLLAVRWQELNAQIITLRTGARSEVAALLGIDASQWPFDNYDALTALVETRTKETKAFETQKLKYQQQKAKILQLSKTIASLEGELKRIQTEDIPRQKTLKSARIDKYFEYFNVLAEERKELSRLYQPLQETLEQGSETDRRLRFEARFDYDLEAHISSGLAILDRTKRGNFRDADALRDSLTQLWDTYTRSNFEPVAMKQALAALHERFLKVTDGETVTDVKIQSQLRDTYTVQDFFDWLLDPRAFRTVSSLTFDETDLYLLSPGQKGIVLLMLYLGMDHADTRPLIIDQPEDNLDNLSVYKDLIRLFRERKQFRQIILVTHNPNLVVNTDAEQVIVATYDGKGQPRITYCSGSLENQAEQIPDIPAEQLTDGIIEQVCDILEGGPGAFGQRFKAYSLSPKIQ